MSGERELLGNACLYYRHARFVLMIIFRLTRFSLMYNLKMLYMKMYFDFIQFLVILIGPLFLRTIATFNYPTSYCYLILKFGYRFTNVIGRDK